MHGPVRPRPGCTDVGGRIQCWAMTSDDVHRWLLDSDPLLRWQVERDLANAPGMSGGRPAPASRRRVRSAAARPAAPRRTVRGRGVLPRVLRFQAPRGRRWRRPAVDGDDLGAEHAARLGAWLPSWATPLIASPRTPVGSTTTCRTGAARSTFASTPGPSPTVHGSAPTFPGSRVGSSSTASPTVDGTATGSRTQPCPRSLDAERPEGTSLPRVGHRPYRCPPRGPT
jgi:hypothetical protein